MATGKLRALPAERKLQELRTYVRSIVQTLPAQERAVILLRYFHVPPKTWTQVAKLLQCSVPTANKWYKHAIERLTRQIRRDLAT